MTDVRSDKFVAGKQRCIWRDVHVVVSYHDCAAAVGRTGVGAEWCDGADQLEVVLRHAATRPLDAIVEHHE